MTQPEGRSRLRSCFQTIAGEAIVDIDGELKERESNKSAIDYKRDLRSATAVNSLLRGVVDAYAKVVARGRTDGFGAPWASSEPVS